MQTRQLGRTGHKSTLTIMGTAAFWDIDQEGANNALELAKAAGVNHIDVAPQYGLAEERLGQWLPPYRDQFFLGCKTLERRAEPAWAELHRSLEKIQTRQFNLYQLHAVGDFAELDAAFAKGGAIETLQRARDEGLTRALGITGHGLQTPAVHKAALERFDFDTVMFPINPSLYANSEYRKETESLLQLCLERNVGVMAIKSVAKGPWGAKEKAYNTWYEPFSQEDMITLGVRFALSQPGVVGIPSAGDVRLLPLVLKAAEEFEPMSETEQSELIAHAQSLEPLFI